jgi:hypothetical protein
MRRFIEASLVLTLSLVITLIVMAVTFPRHALGGGQPALESPRIWPAVFVHGIHDRPGTDGSTPFLQFADRVPSSRCPYLEALAAASKCPAAPEQRTRFACPYLEQLHRQLMEAKRQPAALLGQHT